MRNLCLRCEACVLSRSPATSRGGGCSVSAATSRRCRRFVVRPRPPMAATNSRLLSDHGAQLHHDRHGSLAEGTEFCRPAAKRIKRSVDTLAIGPEPTMAGAGFFESERADVAGLAVTHRKPCRGHGSSTEEARARALRAIQQIDSNTGLQQPRSARGTSCRLSALLSLLAVWAVSGPH